MKTAKAIIKLIGFALLCVIFVPAQYVFLLFGSKKASLCLARLWHKCICNIFGIRMRISGKIYNNSQTLYVCNHLSYLDILALGAILKGAFVGRKDIAEWPVLSTLAKLQHTIFVSRDPSKAQSDGNNMQNALNNGFNIILFPESTSTIGREVLPFKSSPFSIVEGKENATIRIQPITLHLRETDKKNADTNEQRDLYAWHRDMDTRLAVHLWTFLKGRGAKLEIHIHPELIAGKYENRKTLAKECHKIVSKHLQEMIRLK